MAPEKRTALIVAPYFPPHSGGLERYAYEIGKTLTTDQDYHVVVLTSGEKGNIDTVEEMEGMTVHRLGYAVKVSNTPFSLRWIWKTRSMLRTIHPDVIDIHTPVPGIGDLVAFWARKIPFVVTYHAGSMRKGSFVPDIVVDIYEFIFLPYLLRRAAHIICASDFVRNEFLKRYQKKSTTVTPGVDAALFRQNLFARAKNPTILFVAGLSAAEQYKGLSTLIDALPLVREKVPAATLTVLGEGNMIPEYQKMADQKGVGNAITFAGKLFGEALARKYQEAHVLAHPTSNESFGMVILEALSSGLPVVASNVGGIPSLVSDGENGLLIEPGNPVMLAEKIISVLNNSAFATTLGEKGEQFARARFVWKDRGVTHDRIFTAMMRPLIVHAVGYYPPHVGGMERVAKEIAEQLSSDSWRVLVLSSNGKLSGTTERKGNLTVKRLASFEFAHTPVSPTLFLHLFTLPQKSVIHLHLSQAFWPEMVLLVSKICRIPYILHMHLDVAPSGPLGNLFVLYKKIFWPLFLRNAKTVIACSDELAVLAKERYMIPEERIVLMPNGVGDSFFSDRIYTPSPKKLRILYIGRLAAQKCVDRLIEAMAALTVPAELTIVGDGEEREKLEALVNTLQLSNVTFVGEKNDEEMRAYREENDVFVISSDREGRPLAVLEAMAAKLPIVGTNVAGLRELLSETGILIDPPYEVHFAKALTALSKHPEHLVALSKASEEKAKTARWNTEMPKLSSLYNAFI